MFKQALKKIFLGSMLSFAMLPMSVMAAHVEYDVISESEFRGSMEESNTSFSVNVDNEVTTVELTIQDSIIILQKKGDSDFLLVGYDTSGDEFITMPEEYYPILKSLHKEIFPHNMDYELSDAESELYSTLNMLYTWPETLPLAFLKNPQNVFYMSQNNQVISKTRKEYEASNNQGGQRKWSSLCSKQGENYSVSKSGFYINPGHPPTSPYYLKWASFSTTKTIGEDNCWGRCGVGCWNDGSNLYTKDCAIHDGCVDELGRIHPLCNQLFLSCTDDFFAGKNNKNKCDWEGN